ncbi:MAG TPA: gephyrin-like molybdotransferase Glp [Blastocatellia bacterium]|nr:gephyrin-like molybdotransferase Glp [Blastocatellia bacterium]
MITVDQALRIVMDQVRPLGTETVPLEEALSRILAEDVHADIDLPPFDRARMDGYAVRSADVATAPIKLRLIGEVAAGIKFDGKLQSGEAVKIFTGAPIPDGADAVQKVEVTRANGDLVEILEPVKQGQFITPHASEVAAGEIVTLAGTEIGPSEMAVLASFGYARVTVSRRPRAAVISTGSELVDVSTTPSAAQIRNSNSYTLAAYAERAGAIVDMLGTAEDTPEATREALIRSADNRDLVITSGGVSMGDYDLVKAALKDIGAEIFFDKVIIRPGKPIVFARRDHTYFFGLPGNPVSTSVTFNVFVRPAIRRMQGDPAPVLPVVRGCLSRAVKDSSSRRSYLPARLLIEDGRVMVEPLKWGGSSDLVAFMRANALIVVPADVHHIEEGELVDVMVLYGTPDPETTL